MTWGHKSSHAEKVDSLHFVYRTSIRSAGRTEVKELFFVGREENFSCEQAADERNLKIKLSYDIPSAWLIPSHLRFLCGNPP